MTTLDKLRVGQKARVLAIQPGSSSAEFLCALGLLPGTSLEIERVAPLADPIAIVFNGQRISVRLKDAGGVTVAPE